MLLAFGWELAPRVILLFIINKDEESYLAPAHPRYPSYSS